MDLHPVLTHFPLVLLVCAGALEGYSVFRMHDGRYDRIIIALLAGAALCGVAAFITGLDAADHADITFAVPDDAIAVHYNFARVCLALLPGAVLLKYVSVTAKFNRKLFITIYYLILIAALCVVGGAGYYGGQLVFRWGAGVAARSFK